MRVISGEYRHRILQEVPSTTTRETKDRVKESICNSIQSSFFQADVLDLFAGSGSLGIEAISRGSKAATFVDSNPLAIDTIGHNVQSLQINHQSDIVFMDALEFLQTTTKRFDIIFLDPPYKDKVLETLVKQIADKKLLHEDGIIILLYDKTHTLKQEIHGIIEYKKKTMGITNVSWMKWGNEYEKSSLSR